MPSAAAKFWRSNPPPPAWKPDAGAVSHGGRLKGRCLAIDCVYSAARRFLSVGAAGAFLAFTAPGQDGYPTTDYENDQEGQAGSPSQVASGRPFIHLLIPSRRPRWGSCLCHDYSVLSFRKNTPFFKKSRCIQFCGSGRRNHRIRVHHRSHDQLATLLL